jgi:hypothetical protein
MIRGCALVTIAVVLSIPTAASECPGLLSSLVIERVPDGGEPAEPARILDVAADGTLGAAVHPDGVVVFDLTDPTDPAIIGTSPEGEWSAPTWDPPRCIALSGRTALVCDWHRDEVVIFDLTDPQAIEVVARVPADGVHDVAVVGSIAYVAAGSLHVLDITDPSQPVELGAYPTRSWAPSVAVDHPWAYVTEWTEGLFVGLHVIDVSDPANQTGVGEALDEDLSCCGSVAVSDGWVYVADALVEGIGFLNLVDARDPRAPVERGVDEFIPAHSVEVIGSSLLVSRDAGGSRPGGVSQFRIDDTGQPRFVGHREMAWGRIAKAGDVALVAGGESGVLVVRPCVSHGPALSEGRRDGPVAVR